MKDEGWAGYIWDRSTIRLALVLACLAVFAIFTSISSYHYHLNDLKRQYLEKTASDILGTKVTIGGFFWHPLENSVILTEIKIANPPGFDIPVAIYIANLRMNTESVTPSLMVFNQATIAHTIIHLTLGRDASNLGILHAHMARDTPVLSADGKPFTVIIKDVQVKDGMAVQPDVVPADRQLSNDDVEPLHLTAIGEKEKGIPVAQAVTLVVDQIIRQTFIAAARFGALEGMSKNAVLEIKSSFGMEPDFVDLAARGAIVNQRPEITPGMMRHKILDVPRR